MSGKVPTQKNKLDVDLNKRDPFVNWQMVDVQFPDTPNTDFLIPHNLRVANPYDIHYKVVKAFTPGDIYESDDVDAKKWTPDYIVLRSDMGGWTGRIQLGTLWDVENFNPGQFVIPEPPEPPSDNEFTVGLAITIDGVGNPITTGFKNAIRIPFDCIISSVTLLSCDGAIPTSGNIVLDIWKEQYSGYPPTAGNSITAAAKPTITSGIAYYDSTLSGWTKTVITGDVIGFNVDSVSSFFRVTVILGLDRTI
jgi:hypothetical protein